MDGSLISQISPKYIPRDYINLDVKILKIKLSNIFVVNVGQLD